jgi:predicted Zn finger-like uncharacterized protein
MLIVCPSCATPYRVETACFGQTGRLVRCVRCGDVWLATESLLVPAIIAENEQVDIGAASAPASACDAQSQELSTPDAFPHMGGLPDEGDTFEPDTAALELQGDTAHDDPLGITTESLEFAPQDQPAAPASSVLEGALARWDSSALTASAQIEATPPQAAAALQAYVIRRPQRGLVQRSRRRACYLLMTVLALVALHSAFIGWRKQVVKLAPQTASLYRAVGLPVDLRGLAITNITTVAQLQEGVPLLLVEGTLASTSTRTVKVSRLRLAVRNRAGQELYNWTQEPERRTLAGGESLTFRASLASPPTEAHDVVVRFFNREDAAGMQQTAAMRTPRRGEP